MDEGDSFQTLVTGLIPGQQYYYRCAASNDSGTLVWADEATNFWTLAYTGANYVTPTGAGDAIGTRWVHARSSSSGSSLSGLLLRPPWRPTGC
ncbi:hypothetical protein ACFLSJ_01335 [Verrucomicrobiota bacterium]